MRTGRFNALAIALRGLGEASRAVCIELAAYLERSDAESGDESATPELLSVEQASLLTGAGERRIRDAANAGELPAYRPGRELRISRDHLLSWAARSPVRPVLALESAGPADDFDPEAVLRAHGLVPSSRDGG